ncbi:MAG: MBL fold metallo-hydrolase [Candidatus Obscuribacterales bacterium]|jgi:glyoxylase-like metal-dependent hydrolase (beta-lactamase superfamily II)/ferredoxin|nr:MBL fold metallo-hydrolase [Candidatus Obscuribacterales bacterium]
MADQKKRLTSNVDGEFFVDSTCIDCDACRQIAPTVFAEFGNYSSVKSQPQSEQAERQAWQALLACPVAAIGCIGKSRANEIQEDFPIAVTDDIFYCGFTSRKSYGANSYFVQHAGGNWLIESPRYVNRLAERLDLMGGVKYIFLSHRDDVADAAKYAEKWNSSRIIHLADLDAEPNAEIILEGSNDTEMEKDFRIIFTPGHTEGHCVLLYKNRYLFTGDHLHYDRELSHLAAYRDYCWYSWSEQKESMAKLTHYSFEWILPGHGQSVNLPADTMKSQLEALVSRM